MYNIRSKKMLILIVEGIKCMLSGGGVQHHPLLNTNNFNNNFHNQSQRNGKIWEYLEVILGVLWLIYVGGVEHPPPQIGLRRANFFINYLYSSRYLSNYCIILHNANGIFTKPQLPN